MSYASGRSNRRSVIAGLCGSGEEFSRQGFADIYLQAEEQAYPAWCYGGSGKAGARETEPRLALMVHEKEKQKGDRNRATLAVAGKIVAWMELRWNAEDKPSLPAEEKVGRQSGSLKTCP